MKKVLLVATCLICVGCSTYGYMSPREARARTDQYRAQRQALEDSSLAESARAADSMEAAWQVPEIDACGADIVVTQYTKSLFATIKYESLECRQKADSLEAVKAFRKPALKVQPRLYLSFNQGFLASTDAFTLIILKDGEVKARKASGKPWTTDPRGRGTYKSSLYWSPSVREPPPKPEHKQSLIERGMYWEPVDPPFECIIITSYKSEHVLRFTVEPVTTNSQKSEKLEL